MDQRYTGEINQCVNISENPKRLRSRKSRGQWTEADLKSAMNDYNSGKMCVNEAATNEKKATYTKK